MYPRLLCDTPARERSRLLRSPFPPLRYAGAGALHSAGLSVVLILGMRCALLSHVGYPGETSSLKTLGEATAWIAWIASNLAPSLRRWQYPGRSVALQGPTGAMV